MKRLLVTLLIVAAARASSAQQLPPAAEAAVNRATQMASNRDTVGARRVLDSLVNARESTPLVRGEASYWLSRFAGTAEDRERILGALIIDYPFSARVPRALYELGTMELDRGERDRAAAHLTRYLSAAPDDSGRVAASLALGKLLLERGETPRACAVLLVGRSEVPPDAIELRNQFEFSVGRCQGVDTTTRIEKVVADTTPAESRTGAFTVQVAAYDTKAGADRLATTLRGQGLEARVVGKAKPFRVRVGRYATRSEAEEASRRVDSVAKSKSIVVIVGPEER